MSLRCVLYGVLLVACFLSQGSAQNCPVPNDYFADSQQCDAYVECKDGIPERKLCPDGLMFNDRLSGYPRYPCSYPQEVQCGSRTRTRGARVKRLPRIGRRRRSSFFYLY